MGKKSQVSEHVEPFGTWLRTLGYAPFTHRAKARIVSQFARWAETKHLLAEGWRRQVIPLLTERSATVQPCASAPRRGEHSAPAGPDLFTAGRQRPADPSRIPWAELLRRVFRDDVLICPCGGRRVVLAYLTQPGPVRAILEHRGLPSTGPPIAPARFDAGS